MLEGKLPPALLCCKASPHSTGIAKSYSKSGHTDSFRDPQMPLMSEDHIYKGYKRNPGVYLLVASYLFYFLFSRCLIFPLPPALPSSTLFF